MEQETKIEKQLRDFELKKMELESPAKDVAGRHIGKQGLAYITLIILVGVGASIVLDADKIAAVMSMLATALMALIQMVNGVAGTASKQERPEFEVIKSLIERLDKPERKEQPMKVTVIDGQVTVRKGDDEVSTNA